MTAGKQKLRVLLADGDAVFLQNVAELLREEDTIELVTAQDGRHAMRVITQQKPVLAVLDATLRLQDGLTITSELRNAKNKLPVMILSEFSSLHLRTACTVLEIDGLLRKPMLPSAMRERILLWFRCDALAREQMEGKDLKRRISFVLRELQVAQGTQGRRVLAAGIGLVYAGRQAITKEVYPEVAKLLGTTAPRVERAMRSALESAWKTDNLAARVKYLGCAVGQQEKRPANGTFLSAVAEYLHHEQTDAEE